MVIFKVFECHILNFFSAGSTTKAFQPLTNIWSTTNGKAGSAPELCMIILITA